MHKTIPEAFFEAVEKHKNKPALLYKKEGVYFPITYKDLAKKVEIFSQCLLSLGVVRGDRVAILSENRPEWVISDLAIMTIGAITVPLHTTFNPKAVVSVLKHCAAKILIVSNSDLLNKVLLGRKQLKSLEKIIFLESPTLTQKEVLGNQIISWRAIFSRGEKGVAQGEYIRSGGRKYLDPNECCSIIYTSGTTGKPKGVVLSHINFLSNVEAVNEVVPIKEKDVLLSFLPVSHVLERLAGYYIPLCYGATIAYVEDIKQLPINLKEIKPTIIISVPRIFEKFHDKIWDRINSSPNFQKKIFRWALQQKRGTVFYRIADFFVFKKIRQLLGGNLRLAISGGAALSENIARFFFKIGVLILEGYGLTETSPVISVNRERDFKFGTVGKVIPGVKVKIADNKEILVKGPNVFSGYFKNKKESKICFDKEGWFHTGDLGFLDRQGFLTIIGRKKEMIVTSGGKNVWPEPIESLLNNDRFISQSMIVGNKRKFVSALIVPDWEEVEIYFKQNNLVLQSHDKMIKNPTLLEIFRRRIDEKINPQLHDYERIKKIIILPQEFSQDRDELTPTLKLRRHIIEKHYQRAIESMYS